MYDIVNVIKHIRKREWRRLYY